MAVKTARKTHFFSGCFRSIQWRQLEGADSPGQGRAQLLELDFAQPREQREDRQPGAGGEVSAENGRISPSIGQEGFRRRAAFGLQAGQPEGQVRAAGLPRQAQFQSIKITRSPSKQRLSLRTSVWISLSPRRASGRLAASRVGRD